MANRTGTFTLGRLLVCLAWFVCQSLAPRASAQGNFPAQLRPAEGTYRVVVNGIPVGLSATIRLEKAEPGYRLQFTARNRLFKHEESAHFDWQNCTATPYHYQHASAGFGMKRGGEIRFDWGTEQALGSKATYNLAADTLDALSVAMVARCHMANGDQSFSYAVAEPDGMTQYHYASLGTDFLETPAGTWEVAGLERDYTERGRHSEFWAARELNYFMVRMDHRENPFIRGRIELTGFRYLDEDDNKTERHEGSTVTSR
ncbi:DUF3108 domain-containing protein [Alcanivorax sp.]|uniref:DUF3108 domain-containing protein n=1 Tax=Alcanivorax sp. TaxID=1872427 RepID=UPI0032D8F2C2